MSLHVLNVLVKERCLCIVEEDVIKAFSQSGNIESTPLLFKVGNRGSGCPEGTQGVTYGLLE